MKTTVYIRGDFLDIYPYMNWIFLLTQEGDLLYARTEQLVENTSIHDFMFRQNRVLPKDFSDPVTHIELNLSNFSKIAKISDKFTFSDLRFFYSNIICGSTDGLEFLTFDTSGCKITKNKKITDAPINSIAAKYMTVFASSLEAGVTTLFGVDTGTYSSTSLSGPQTSRVGISDKSIFYYSGRTDVQYASYVKSKSEDKKFTLRDEDDKECINDIGEVVSYNLENEDSDFVFNANGGIYFKVKNRLYYRKDSDGALHDFPLDIHSKIIKAHLFAGKKCFEFINGLYISERNKTSMLLPGECITTRGYVNSINYKETVGAVNDDGAFLFRI